MCECCLSFVVTEHTTNTVCSSSIPHSRNCFLPSLLPCPVFSDLIAALCFVFVLSLLCFNTGSPPQAHVRASAYTTNAQSRWSKHRTKLCCAALCCAVLCCVVKRLLQTWERHERGSAASRGLPPQAQGPRVLHELTSRHRLHCKL